MRAGDNRKKPSSNFHRASFNHNIFAQLALVAQPVWVFHGLLVPSEEHGAALGFEIERLTFVSYEPRKIWPGMDRPHLNGSHHKGARKIIPHKSPKETSSLRLKAMEKENGSN
jgi:hypothetical protein